MLAAINSVLLCMLLSYELKYAIFLLGRVRFHFPTTHDTHTHNINDTLRHAITSYYKPLQYLIYIYSVSLATNYLLLTKAENAQPTVSHRFTLIACVSMDYIGGEHP